MLNEVKHPGRDGDVGIAAAPAAASFGIVHDASNCVVSDQELDPDRWCGEYKQVNETTSTDGRRQVGA